VPEDVHDREMILFQNGKMEITKLEKDDVQIRSPILMLRNLNEMQQSGVGYTEGGILPDSLNGGNPGWVTMSWVVASKEDGKQELLTGVPVYLLSLIRIIPEKRA